MLDWGGQRCAICGAPLGRELLRIAQPDRFERHVGIGAQGYDRRWIECSGCGAASNVQSPGNRERLETIAAGYYEVDLAGSSVAEKYAKVMSLPAEKSDNAQRVKRTHSFLRGRGVVAGRVLDIGAGTGVFLSRFLREGSGWSGVAVEPGSVDRAVAPEIDVLDAQRVTAQIAVGVVAEARVLVLLVAVIERGRHALPG